MSIDATLKQPREMRVLLLEESMYSLKDNCQRGGAANSARARNRFPLVLLACIPALILPALCIERVRSKAAGAIVQTNLLWSDGYTFWHDAFAATTKASTEHGASASALARIAAIAPQSNGAKFYVSASGRDNNDGSLAAPYRTIMRALLRAKPGDAIMVRGGIYRENIKFPRSGTEGAPITLMNYPGEIVKLDGTGLPERDCFTITTQSYITIDGFIIRNYKANNIGGWGLVVWDVAGNITLRNVEMYNLGAPIKVAGSGGNGVRSNYVFENVNAHDYSGSGLDLGPGRVENVVVRNVQLSGVTTGNDTGSDAIAVENGSNILIEDTIVRGHMGDGVDCKADHVTLRRVDASGFGRNGIKVWKGNAIIENCWVDGSRNGLGALIMGGAGSYMVRNSVFIGSAGTAGTGYGYSIEAGVYGSSLTDAPTTVTLYGNTFHTEGNGGTLINFYNNARLQSASDYNTYYSPRQDSIFTNVRNASAATMPLVTPASINNGAWARFIHGEAHSRFSPRMPAQPAANASPANSMQRPRRAGAP